MKWILIGVICAIMMISSSLSENIFLKNIPDLKYAPKIGERALPVKEDDKGDLVYQGRKFSNPGDYVEEEYLANQYHGQDGLGRYLFGYSDWNQGRAEGKNAKGEVRGAYKYVDSNGKDFIANYWTDSTGFHQEDNRPKIVLEPAYTPAVKAAREEHFKLWREIAESGKEARKEHLKLWREIAESGIAAREEHFKLWREIAESGNAGREEHFRKWREIPEAGKANPHPNSDVYNPRGFFYSFDYPVQLARNLKEREELLRKGQESS